MTFTPNILSQNDPRWKDLNLGFHATETIGEEGCALTCLSMMATGYGYPETPDQLNKKLIALGSASGYIGSLMVWAGMTRIYPKIGIKDVYVCSDVKPVPLKRIDSLLDYGQTVLVEIDSSLLTGEQSHWVLLTGKKGNDYIMLDPLPYPQEENDQLLLDRYAYGRPIDQVITSVVFYECWERGDGTPVLPALKGTFVKVLASVTSGLRLRVQPNKSATIVIKENAGTPLLVLEDEEDAGVKIGVTDQWIKVRDPQGFEGYVAAWYLEECQLPIIEEELVPEPDIKPLEPEPELKPIGPEPEVIPITPEPSYDSGPLKESKKRPPPKINQSRKQHDARPKDKPANLEKTPSFVYVSADVAGRGLRMRKKPDLTAETVTVLDARQKLEIIEEVEAAKTKVGSLNQWIQVRSEKGEKGYCAAWLLVLPVVQHVTDQVLPSQDVEGFEVDPQADTQPSVFTRSVPEPILIEDPSQMSPSQEVEKEFRVKVSKNVGKVGLRLRTAPETGSLIKVIKAGTELTVLESTESARTRIGVEGNWLYVKDDKGIAGYTAAWYLEPVVQSEVNRASGESALMVNVSPVVGNGGLRLRSAPNLKSEIVKKLPPLTPLVVLEPLDSARPKIGVMDQWLNVSTADGAAGYVAAWYVMT